MSTRIFSLTTGRAATAANHGLTFSLEELLPDEDGEVRFELRARRDLDRQYPSVVAGLHRPAHTLDRQANIGVDQSQPKTCP